MAFLLVLLLLCSCGSVKKTLSTTTSTKEALTTTVVDTVHVVKYDTSITTHEINQYQTKTVEVFDTIITPKDSVVTVLKTRTIYTSGQSNKTETKAGTGSDSISGKGTTQNISKTENTASNSSIQRTSTPWWLYILILVVGVCVGAYFKNIFMIPITFIKKLFA